MRTTIIAERWDDLSSRRMREFSSLTIGEMMAPRAPSGPNGSALPKFTIGAVMDDMAAREAREMADGRHVGPDE
jgi:hypothetical protein